MANLRTWGLLSVSMKRSNFERLSSLKMVGIVLVFCIATAIASLAQTFTTLVNLDGANGANPQFMSLIQGTDGDLYGTTWMGGNLTCNAPDGCGTVFKITPEGTFATLHSFDGTDGSGPYAGLVQATNGNFYGTTLGGGANNAGTVFKITLSGKLTTLYSFCSQPSCSDGDSPYAGLVQASDGNLYGTTGGGGGQYLAMPL